MADKLAVDSLRKNQKELTKSNRLINEITAEI